MPSPVCPAERGILPARHSRSWAPPRYGTRAGRVLVADPCTDTVETAASGPEALEAALAARPDVVLMELALPMLDGLQVARRIREWAVGPVPLLVAVTGYGAVRDRARSREAGFDCHFVKPVCPEIVRASGET